MLSVLARQLERYRDLSCVWHEQRDVARLVVARREQKLSRQTDLKEDARREREEIEQEYKLKARSLREVISAERQKLDRENEEVRRNNAAATAEETRLGDTINGLEAKNSTLRESLEAALTKLNTVKTAMSQFQADIAANDLTPMGQSSEHAQALQRVDALLKKKHDLHLEAEAAKVSNLELQDSLNRQRSSNLVLENFIRKIATVGNGYVLEPTAKREATTLLQQAARLRSAAESYLDENPIY